MFKKSLLFSLILCISTVSFGQVTKFIDSGSVKTQFDYLINQSNNQYDAKVVKLQWLQKLKSNVNDSISKSKNIISITKNNILIQQQEIDSLKTALTSAENLNTQLSDEQNEISIFGIGMDKTSFKTLVFTLILILAALFMFFYYKFKQSDTVTNEAKQHLKDLEEEFTEYKTKALEREQKAMRRLQDELNKHKKD